jgi:hypothetical protein
MFRFLALKCSIIEVHHGMQQRKRVFRTQFQTSDNIPRFAPIKPEYDNENARGTNLPTGLPEETLFHSLLTLTLAPKRAAEAAHQLSTISEPERQQFLDLASSNHVVLRALRVLLPVAGNGSRGWIERQLDAEQQRIANALPHLARVCATLDENACPTVVIKSLDHWPDLGNDLDLFTTAPEQKIVKVFQQNLGATPEARSWGDRLAQKWNFRVPGLQESVEVHCQRLGQTGEHIALAKRFIARRIPIRRGEYTFFVPAPEERIVVATLQRMYRHFYFRICDIVNSAALVESGAVVYRELRRAASLGGIWPGVATYLQIVSDYVERFRGEPLRLPEFVRAEARFGAEKVMLRRGFLRVPVLPEGAGLYTSQISTAAKRWDMPATLRLSLLPPLASAAAVAYKITGSDKGIW